jgi:glutamine amidotransferase
MKRPKINIIDYGIGNIRSISNAMELLNCDIQLTSDKKSISNCDALILPGVGSFSEAIKNLNSRNLIEPIISSVENRSIPILGICLGMQLLADSSEEGGNHKGLSLIPGVVKKIPISENLKLPHMGWNGIFVKNNQPLFHNIKNDSDFYFVHSYRFECQNKYISSITNHGVDIVSSVQKGHIFGIQFHPERSQRKGILILQNFVKYIQNNN